MGIDGPDYALIIWFIALQAPGTVFTFWRRRRLRWFVRAALVLAPAFVFFVFTNVHFDHVIEAIRARGSYVCGAFGFFVVFVVFGGTAVHLVFGSAVQACHTLFTRLQERHLRRAHPAGAV